MSAEAVHRANPRCDQCRGAGVLVLTEGALAQGRLCGCVPVCDRCGGEGRLHLQEGGISRVARCRCRMLPDRIGIFNQADIPSRHATATFEAFDKDIEGAMPGFVATWRWVNAWPDAGALPSRGLLLHGGVGRGKTHLLVAALRHLVFQHGVRVKFVEFTHLLAALRQGFEEGRGQSSTLQALGDFDRSGGHRDRCLGAHRKCSQVIHPGPDTCSRVDRPEADPPRGHHEGHEKGGEGAPCGYTRGGDLFISEGASVLGVF